VRRIASLLGLAVLLLCAGCVSLPTTGPVKAGPAQQQIGDQGALDFTPAGPERGATPVEIVANFLSAMTATPLNTSVAREYLTDESSRSWVPERTTVVYGGQQIARTGSGVALTLDDTVQLDGRGEWLGDPTHGTGLHWRLRLVREDGEWRISDPPDALVIPRAHFDARFTQYFLYFFDDSDQVLVPEPVYVPRGAQAPTELVSGLLRGPDRDLLGVERTQFPAGTRLDDLSVPVTRDGTAEVPLSDEVLHLDRSRLGLVFAQLAWTLGQVPGVERIRVTVDGSPLDLPGGAGQVRVDQWSQYDPAVAWASQSLFGLRDGRVVAVVGGEERRVSGAFGALDLGLRSFAVDLPAENIAAVTTDGSRVLVAPRNQRVEAAPTPSDAVTVYSGDDVLKPSYDLYGQLWLVDRTTRGARLVVVRDGRPRVVDAPGITGEDVRSMAVSRDGTRLLVTVRGRASDQLRLARVVRSTDGQVRALAPAQGLAVGLPAGSRVRDLGWRTPGTIALLITAGNGTSQVGVVKMDGSSALGDPATDAELFRGRAQALVTSPVLGTPLYVTTRSGNLLALASIGRWTGSGVEPGLRAPTFVG
jgi:hypothetical protein